jgi:uncharacterized protein GlcG (DUF336 family)
MSFALLLRRSLLPSTFASVALAAGSAAAAPDCQGLPTQKALAATLAKVVVDGNAGIFKPNMMWATIVNRAGQVCAVAKVGDAWPGSRVISAQKAFTANAFSNDHLALSTANLYSAVQPGGSLYGLQQSNPVDASAAYKGDGRKFGTPEDNMVGARVGGVNVFGGGLALYAKGKKAVLGGLGVSGDTSCTDHVIAWKLRQALSLDAIPGGICAAKDDNIIFDIDGGKSAGGFGHPACSPEVVEVAKTLKLSSAP